ncbi:MAG: TetR family transcriptional regulator [Porticoccaceae bacterium]|nr:TetR family transcriptional regulator [Porticoccaceae bacterium]
MSTVSSLRDILIDQTIHAVAEKGFEDISLRAVTSDAGCSTAAVFQYFGSKAGLIDAAMKKALQNDLDFHRSFAETTAGLVLSQRRFAHQLAFYIEQRSQLITARFWSEIMFKSGQTPKAGEHLRAWHAMRITFWQSRLHENNGNPGLAPILACYCTMEEAYAYALNGQLAYSLMLRETAEALTAQSFAGDGDIQHSEISEWLDRSAHRFEVSATAERNALSQGLLDLAAKHIVHYGVDALTQRKITKLAGTSSAMIAYHFGNLDAFVNEAIWRALAVDIPNEVHPNLLGNCKQTSLSQWADLLTHFIVPARESDNHQNGFFIGVARIIGQAALLVKHRQKLHPIVDHMRKFEGRGSYNASQTIWPPDIKISRAAAAAFAVWVKGQAIVNEAFDDNSRNNKERLLDVASLIFGVQKP